MESAPLKLNILIVGASIASLTAITALRTVGHKITIFASSTPLNEVGAAITLAPNGTRLLSHLGFEFEAAKGVRIKSPSMYFGDTLEQQTNASLRDMTGFPSRSFQRVDLHNGLKKLALRDDGEGSVEIFLGVRIVWVDVENAELELDDGRVWKGGLLFGADGMHSCVRKAALEFSGEEEEIEDLGWDINRWLLDRKTVEEDEELREVWLQGNDKSILVWYSCRKYDTFTYRVLMTSLTDLQPRGTKSRFRKAESIKTWRLRNRAPTRSFVYGKTILIGDAAHTNLPFNGQGGNQALEDCAALQKLFTDVTSKDIIPERTKLFNTIRWKRASRIQINSGVPGS
ncbi:hypothetical protein DL95DRAFT_288067 [Leptodontidium sp. 2 PMI_412]|nr:hypothetical protein DL95DRAFT_288067 [Leptodontidium sp. 2 PMI_412]